MDEKNGVTLEGFSPIHFCPIPVVTAGLSNNQVMLDGVWGINASPDERADPAPGDEAGGGNKTAEGSINGAEWKDFTVPGQWAQQGFDVPQDRPVAVAKEFMVPAEWAGCRMFLRFDAIHAGTTYTLNGRELGYSENLFTPVEWDITEAARPGEVNRLDLRMVVDTASEVRSHSCFYAGHNLGGIDRSVRIFAAPPVHVSRMKIVADLDSDYRDGELRVDLGIRNSGEADVAGIAISAELFDAKGNGVEHSVPDLALETLKQGDNSACIRSRVPEPLKWNAEQPNLYKLVLKLKRNGVLLERIERQIGFRKIEIKGRQFYINGANVKLAGVCRHEIDPLTGRADTARHAEEDIRLFKNANLNHLRTAHYPCTQELLDAADRLGFYVELEAPFCWSGLGLDMKPDETPLEPETVLIPTSAMIDYCHAHPSVIIWSLANESKWHDSFALSHKLCKQLDLTRPTTFSGPLPHDWDKGFLPIPEDCDILNRHYMLMPYDAVLADDPRPLLHGECFFIVYHERTEVAVNPGLKELWAHGSVDPNSEWGRFCARSNPKRGLRPGVPAGAWSHIYESERLIGSEIWAGIDDIAYLPDGTAVSSEKGNACWGLFDGWWREKPELWYSKHVFSPVWFPVFQVEYQAGQAQVRIPVENRYSFVDFGELDFAWEAGEEKGTVKYSLAPGCKGEVEIPIPPETREGDLLLLWVTDPAGNLIVARGIQLGQKKVELPKPAAGAPNWKQDGDKVVIEGKGFVIVLDRSTGTLAADDPEYTAPVLALPKLHVAQYDYGDLAFMMKKPPLPFAEFPDAATRVVDEVSVIERAEGLEIAVKDRYVNFAGSIRWLIDKDGGSTVAYDYTYTGSGLEAREIGMDVLLRAEHDEVEWLRWSEWGVFPEDHISRTKGRARARRDEKLGSMTWSQKPAWPWSLNQTELGTAEFRAMKFNVYEASLMAADGSRVSAHANGDVPSGVAVSMRNCAMMSVFTQSGDIPSIFTWPSGTIFGISAELSTLPSPFARIVAHPPMLINDMHITSIEKYFMVCPSYYPSR